MEKKFIIASLVMLLSAILLCQVDAREPNEKTIKDVLCSDGIDVIKVTMSGDEVAVVYRQEVSKFGDLDEESRRIATILTNISNQSSSTRRVRLEQRFDDGQIMEIIGEPEGGKAFLSGQISAETLWMEILKVKPLTRGFPILPGRCEPNKGNNCANCEACACYPNEVCAPDNPQANKRGCVERYAPVNAHLIGSEYVCNNGYEWNSELTSCVPEKKCPQHSFRFQGDCYCNPGYGPSADGSECVQTGSGSTTIAGKPQAPTGPKAIVTTPTSSFIKQTFLLNSIPPSPWTRATAFSFGDTIYAWVETALLYEPHTLEIVWIDPSGKAVKLEGFELRGWGAGENIWSELKTSQQVMPGQWNIDLIVDGSHERSLSFLLEP